MLIGSCFTEYIGEILTEFKFPMLINPAGIQYNPLSIQIILDRIMAGSQFTEDELEFSRGKWFSYLHHSDFSSPEKGKCLDKINKELAKALDFLTSADFLIITFGTAWYYTLKKTGTPVSNCHKRPSSLFNRHLLEPEEIYSMFDELFRRLRKLNPALRILFTVSPVRHLKDGLTGNQLSKSSLIVAVHRLCRDLGCEYFPAYEIIMDDLRDYRFYAEDMVHPAPKAVRYIWDRFSDTYMDERTRLICGELESVSKALRHRPRDSGSGEYITFLQNTTAKINSIEQRHPEISLSAERDYFCREADRWREETENP